MGMHSEEDVTFITQLQKFAKERPDKPAFIFVDKDLTQRTITRQQVWDKARKYAAVLKRLGLGKGDVVCNTLVNSPERLLTYFGTLASGAAPSQGQLFLADGSDLIQNLKESKSKAIIYDPRDPNGAWRILDTIKFTDEATGAIGYKDLPDLKVAIEIEAREVIEEERWINVIDKEKEMFFDESITEDDTAMVFVTSGTTGFSKLVPHTHKTLLTAMWGFSDLADLNEERRIFNMQSLGWLGGFPAWYSAYGSERIIIDLTKGPPESLGTFLVNLFNQNSPHVAFLITRDIQAVLDALDEGSKFDKLVDTLFTGGGPVHNATMESLGRIAHKILIGYGGTEFLLVSAIEVTKKSDFQDMCTGRPMNCQVRIVGDAEEDVPIGEQGEILMRSGTVFRGYLNNPAKTAAAFNEDGWYKTGDMGYFNKQGQLFVLCRKADAICKDGFIHYPGWMEQLINKHSDIENSIVIGFPDPVHGEDICLCFKKMPDVEVSIDDIREHCKKLFLTGENDKMTPLPKHYLVFDEFITNANGKVDRNKMREEVLRRLNLDT